MTSAVGSPRARALSAALRGARENSGWSARRLADRLSIDQSHLSRIESGKRVPSLETTAMILASLRTAPDEGERILDLARNANEPNWLTVGIPGISQQLAGAMESERVASAITAWHPCLVPGLLQTREYAKSIVAANAALYELTDRDVETRVAAKAARSALLERRTSPHFTALLPENVLREIIGDRTVMVEQLRHLISMSKHIHVVVRIIPRGVGWHPGLAGPFVFYEFNDTQPVVHFEHHQSGVFDQDVDDVSAYRKAIKEISRLALGESRSVELIGETIVGRWG